MPHNHLKLKLHLHGTAGDFDADNAMEGRVRVWKELSSLLQQETPRSQGLDEELRAQSPQRGASAVTALTIARRLLRLRMVTATLRTRTGNCLTPRPETHSQGGCEGRGISDAKRVFYVYCCACAVKDLILTAWRKIYFKDYFRDQFALQKGESEVENPQTLPRGLSRRALRLPEEFLQAPCVPHSPFLTVCPPPRAPTSGSGAEAHGPEVNSLRGSILSSGACASHGCENSRLTFKGSGRSTAGAGYCAGTASQEAKATLAASAVVSAVLTGGECRLAVCATERVQISREPIHAASLLARRRRGAQRNRPASWASGGLAEPRAALGSSVSPPGPQRRAAGAAEFRHLPSPHHSHADTSTLTRPARCPLGKAGSVPENHRREEGPLPGTRA